MLGAALPTCCSRKEVGGVEFVLTIEEDTSAYNCLSDCIYEKLGEPGISYCFTWGNLEVVCKGDITVNSETMSEPENGGMPHERKRSKKGV
jgi:hypothetical protein